MLWNTISGYLPVVGNDGGRSIGNFSSDFLDNKRSKRFAVHSRTVDRMIFYERHLHPVDALIQDHLMYEPLTYLPIPTSGADGVVSALLGWRRLLALTGPCG